jgi:hypothetical protein
MQSISPQQMISAAIAIFTGSEEVQMLESFLDNLSLLQLEDTEKIIQTVCNKAESLDMFTSKLAQIADSLSQKGLFAELCLSEGDPKFKKHMVNEIKHCVKSAYGRKPTDNDIGPAYFAALIRKDDKATIASSLCDFRPYPYNELVTRIEAVDKKWQRQQVGTSLFKFTESIAEFLMMADGFVRVNLAGIESKVITLKSHVDHDAPEWHSNMMEGLGFEEDGKCDGDVVFFKEIDFFY